MDINYNDLIEKYIEIIRYAMKSSDCFSIITNLRKPYSKIPPNCEHDDILKEFEPYLIEQTINIREWPGTVTRANRKVMNVYRSCRETRKIMLNLPNIFSPIHYDLPEDICFYRNSVAWLATVSHEKMAFMYHKTKADIAFLSEHSIRFYGD